MTDINVTDGTVIYRPPVNTNVYVAPSFQAGLIHARAVRKIANGVARLHMAEGLTFGVATGEYEPSGVLYLTSSHLSADEYAAIKLDPRLAPLLSPLELAGKADDDDAFVQAHNELQTAAQIVLNSDQAVQGFVTILNDGRMPSVAPPHPERMPQRQDGHAA